MFALFCHFSFDIFSKNIFFQENYILGSSNFNIGNWYIYIFCNHKYMERKKFRAHLKVTTSFKVPNHPIVTGKKGGSMV